MPDYGPLSYDGPPPASAAWREGDRRRQPAVRRCRRPHHRVRGAVMPAVRVAYETWGTLSAGRHQRRLHLPRADRRRARHRPGRSRTRHGRLVGRAGRPGRAIDTDEWFVVCANVLGGCQGTTGPSSLAPDGQPWGSRFPVVTIARHGRGRAPPHRRYWASTRGRSCWARPSGACGSSSGWCATPIGCAAAWSSARRRPSRPTRSAPRRPRSPRSRPIPAFRGGDYYDAPAGRGPARRHGDRPTHRAPDLPQRDRARPAVRPRPAGRARIPSPAVGSQSSPTSTTTPTSSRAASTPTPTSHSPAR